MLSATITLISAINALSKRIWKDFVIQIIPATFPGLGIIAGFGKIFAIIGRPSAKQSQCPLGPTTIERYWPRVLRLHTG